MVARQTGLACRWVLQSVDWPQTLPNRAVIKLIKNSAFSCLSFQIGVQHPSQFLVISIKAKPLDYMVKPHEQLVLVSSTPHNAYTPSLSTS